MRSHSLIGRLLLTATALLTALPPAAVAGATSAKCACGRNQSIMINAKTTSWTKIATLPASGYLKFDAEGFAWFSDGDGFFEVLTATIIKTAKDVIAGYVCPECAGFAGIIDKDIDKLLGLGLDKGATAFGNDPVNASGLGSKKCGGLLVALGTPGAVTGDCACSAKNVYHLVIDGKKRFGAYSTQHHYLTKAQIEAKKITAGPVYAKAWDQSGGYGDNQGQYGVCVLRK